MQTQLQPMLVAQVARELLLQLPVRLLLMLAAAARVLMAVELLVLAVLAAVHPAVHPAAGQAELAQLILAAAGVVVVVAQRVLGEVMEVTAVQALSSCPFQPPITPAQLQARLQLQLAVQIQY